MDDRQEPDLDSWLAECVERFDQAADPATTLAAMCATWPRHAAALRAALEPLCAFGLAGPLATASLAPTRIGEFEIVRELGRGGMGVVYEARQPGRAETVALKALPRTGDRRLQARFANEARAAATLSHPHIVPILAVGEADGVHWYAMQRVDGTSLGDVLARLGRTPPERRQPLLAELGLGTAPWPQTAARLIAQAADALQWAHDHGIVHRDIKPGNLLLDRRGHVLVADFGLAAFAQDVSSVTQSGEIVGTLAYCSPEQVSGRVAVDERADVYSLGATLYELLTLQRPFGGERAALIRAVLQQEPRSPKALVPDLPRDLVTIVDKAMRKEPARRYRSARALADDLTAFLADRAIVARPVSTVGRIANWSRRNPSLATASGVSVGLAVLAAALAWAGVQAGRERDRAVLAEAHLAQQAAQQQLTSHRFAAQSLQRDLQAGRRTKSLQLLAEVVEQVPLATDDPVAERQLRAGLRTDALAALSLWDLQAEPVGAADAHLLATDRAFELRILQRGDDAIVLDADGKTLAQLSNPGRYPEGEFFADREWVLLSNENGLQVWHWPSGATMVPPDTGSRRGHAMGRDGTLWTSTDDNRIVVFDSKQRSFRDGVGPNGQAIVQGMTEAVFRAHPHPDGRLVAVLPFGASYIWLLDREHDRAHRQIDVAEHVREATWLGTSSHLLIGGRRLDLLRVDATTGTVVERWPGHHSEVTRLTTTADGRLVATAGWDSQLRIWDGEGVPLVSLTTAAPLPALFFGADSSMLGIGALDPARRGAQRWRLLEPAVLATLRCDGLSHCGTAQVAIHPRLPILAMAMHHTVACFSLADGRLLGEVPLPGCRRLCFLADGTLFGAANEASCGLAGFAEDPDGTLHVGPVRPLTVMGEFRCADAVGDTVVFGHQQTLTTWSVDGERRGVATVPAGPLAQIRLSPDGRFAATGVFGRGAGGAVRVLEVATGAVLLEVPLGVGDSAAAVFSPDGRWLAVVRCEEHLVYDTRTWQLAGRVPRRTEAVAGHAAFSPDGGLLVVPSTRASLQVVDTRTFLPLFELAMPDGSSTCEPVFSPDGTRLAIASVHRRAFVWDLRRARIELQRIGLDWTDAPLPPPTGGTVLAMVVHR